MGDHPVIENMQRYGTPDGRAEVAPRCPVCGRECEEVFQNADGEVVGCSECLSRFDAWEVPECYPEEEP